MLLNSSVVRRLLKLSSSEPENESFNRALAAGVELDKALSQIVRCRCAASDDASSPCPTCEAALNEAQRNYDEAMEQLCRPRA